MVIDAPSTSYFHTSLSGGDAISLVYTPRRSDIYEDAPIDLGIFTNVECFKFTDQTLTLVELYVLLGGKFVRLSDPSGEKYVGYEGIEGADGHDRISVSEGRDTINGGAGTDEFNLGPDAHVDTIVVSKTTDSQPNEFADLVWGFDTNKGVFDFTEMDAQKGVPSHQDFDYSSLNSGGVANGVWVDYYDYYSTIAAIVSGDVDGDGVADFSIILLGVTSGITADNFVF